MLPMVRKFATPVRLEKVSNRHCENKDLHWIGDKKYKYIDHETTADTKGTG